MLGDRKDHPIHCISWPISRNEMALSCPLMGAPVTPDGLKPVVVKGVCNDVVGGGRIGTPIDGWPLDPYMIPDPIVLGPGSAKDTLCVLATGRCVVNDGVFKTGV